MKNLLFGLLTLVSISLSAQDSLFNDPDKNAGAEKKPVKIFNSERAIISNTTEPVGRGKMQFVVTHYFDDIAGSNGGLKNFFGLDNSMDVKIGFNIGLTDRLDFTIARAKSGHPRPQLRMEKIYELALKYQLLRQLENDPSHPFALSFFFSNTISSMDTAKTAFYDFKDFGDRNSQVYQLIFAKRIGKVSVQLLPTVIRQGYLINNDLQQTMFALGATVRVPIVNNFNVIVDYFHPFRSEESENSFKDNFSPAIKFYDPLGFGLEFITAGHVFHFNFHNTTQIQEARAIPYNVKSWGEGEFRWGFTISRNFVLWRPKPREASY
ncbi:MAG TPA: DUF5777 family beta-barrel protein [Chitinophagaceae bacterium]